MAEKPFVVRVASPCEESWAEMTGDERVRLCARCKLHVYDLSAMRTGEARELVARTEGRLCVRFFQRADGTVMTADCAVRRLRPERRFLTAWRIAIAGAGIAAVIAVMPTNSAVQPSNDVSPVTAVSFPDWAKRPLPKHQEFRPNLQFAPRREMIMGGLRSQRFPSTQ